MMVSQADSLTERTETGSREPRRYTGFDGQYIDGSWRAGRSGRKLKDNDPYSGEPLAEIALADRTDLDEAYQAAARNQSRWAAKLPAERAEVMLRSAEIMRARHQEIVDWLIHESGSTRIKAEIEWQMLYAITLESSSFPHRASGHILPRHWTFRR